MKPLLTLIRASLQLGLVLAANNEIPEMNVLFIVIDMSDKDKELKLN